MPHVTIGKISTGMMLEVGENQHSVINFPIQRGHRANCTAEFRSGRLFPHYRTEAVLYLALSDGRLDAYHENGNQTWLCQRKSIMTWELLEPIALLAGVVALLILLSLKVRAGG
jgi:hypothetical protein